MTPDFWERLWQAGLPVVLLAIAVFVLWQTWREDIRQAREDRQKNIDAINNLTASFDKLEEKLSSFFLTHFP